MAPDKASLLFEYFVAVVKELVGKVETGRFGTHMLVDIQNDGPVTLILDTNEIMPQKPR
jgi:D-tyrosyl-tRNA(Tyr) deacylase